MKLIEHLPPVEVQIGYLKELPRNTLANAMSSPSAAIWTARTDGRSGPVLGQLMKKKVTPAGSSESILCPHPHEELPTPASCLVS
jgi:hypothetical protein